MIRDPLCCSPLAAQIPHHLAPALCDSQRQHMVCLARTMACSMMYCAGQRLMLPASIYFVSHNSGIICSSLKRMLQAD